MRFSLPSIKCSAGPPSLRLLPNSVRCLNSAQRFDYRALGGSRKLERAAEHLIDGSDYFAIHTPYDSQRMITFIL